ARPRSAIVGAAGGCGARFDGWAGGRVRRFSGNRRGRTTDRRGAFVGMRTRPQEVDKNQQQAAKEGDLLRLETRPAGLPVHWFDPPGGRFAAVFAGTFG